jgi:hypothetical protein
MESDDDLVQRMPPLLSLEEAALIFERDLPSLCEAQLVQVLSEAHKLGPHPLAQMLAPIARAELARRRALHPPQPRSLPEDFPSRSAS